MSRHPPFEQKDLGGITPLHRDGVMQLTAG